MNFRIEKVCGKKNLIQNGYLGGWWHKELFDKNIP